MNEDSGLTILRNAVCEPTGWVVPALCRDSVMVNTVPDFLGPPDEPVQLLHEYTLSVRVSFRTTGANLDRATREAGRHLLHHIHCDAHRHLSEMEVALVCGDLDRAESLCRELRRAMGVD